MPLVSMSSGQPGSAAGLARLNTVRRLPTTGKSIPAQPAMAAAHGPPAFTGIAAGQHSAALQAHRVDVQHAVAARCIEPHGLIGHIAHALALRLLRSAASSR